MKSIQFYAAKSVLLIFVCSLSFTAAAQTVNIQLQSDYTIGNANNTPRYAVGDVNNDGRSDLVTLNKGTTTSQPLSVFLNNGASGFNAPLNLTDASLSPNGVTIGDFNRDGNADLAIAGDGISNGVNIRLGNGTGNFTSGTFISAERGSPAIVSADFSGDGNLDIAVCNNVNELRVLAGNGAGGFAAAVPYTTANACTDLITADFNVDGRPDIVTASRLALNSVQTFLNNGTGGFNAPVNNTVNGAYSLVTADFNRDCIPDLASVQYSGSLVYILIGSGTGSFATSTSTVNNSPAYLTVGDFNRDKKVDLAIRRNTLTAGANNLMIIPGTGTGLFGPAYEVSVATPTNTVEMRLATMDANRDGRDDLIIGRQGGFLLYHGNSSLFTRTDNDFDGDLKTDVSVFRPAGGNWFVQQSTRGFFSQQWGLGTDKPVPADYDGDGKTDIAVWREAAVATFYIFNSATNTVRGRNFGQTGDSPYIGGDWDGDGQADLAVYRPAAMAGGQSFFFYLPSAAPGNNLVTLYWGTAGDAPVRGDFDGDGRLDAAVFRSSEAVWYILQSSNNQPIYRSWGLASDRRVAADYDGDGKTDLAVFRPSDGIWYVLRSANNTAVYRRWGASTDVLVPGDYNGDGTADAAVYRPSEQRWYIPQCANFNQSFTQFGATGDVPVPGVQ